MDVKTKIGTVVTVSEKQILKIPEGLFGFESYKEYAIFDSEFPPFMWMQSTEEEALAFLIVDPFLICDDYEVDVDDKTLLKIGIDSPRNVYVMAIITIPPNGTPITANLQGPLVINKNTGECMQVILNNNRWPTKYDIMKALKKREGIC